ncbi:MAG: hypothetical protein JJE04_12600 [Acidobacteriia bacterium]|nr:hypothetical protein [Terriglobia bacterium]
MNRRALVGWMVAACCTLPAVAQMGGFGGPSILSRGAGTAGRSGGRPVSFRPFAGISAGYFSGLTSFDSLNESGRFGYLANFGAMANSVGKRDFASLDYRGNYTSLRDTTAFGGNNHSMSATYGRQFSPRLTMFLAQGASYYSYLAGNSFTSFSDNPTAQLPNPSSNLFDSKVLALSSAAGITYQKSARLSFSTSGSAFFYRYRDPFLVDTDGYGTTSSVSYLLSRRQSVGASYSFNTFSYKNNFGEAYVHNIMGTFGRIVSPRWTVNLAAGIFQVESERLVRVNVDPFIAAITGQNQVIEAFHGTMRGVSGNASIAGRFSRSSVAFTYQRGISPGNGAYLTSLQDTAGASYTYTGIRYWNIGANVNYSKMNTVIDSHGTFGYLGFGGGVSRRITSILHFNANVNAFRSTNTGDSFQHDRFMATVGITFAPGDMPLPLF